MRDLVLISGVQAEPDDPRLKLLDPAAENVSGVFETLRTYDGRVFALSEHLDRLKHSAHALGCELPLSKAEIETIVHSAVRTFDDESVRCKIVATADDLIVHCTELTLDPSIMRNGVRVTLAQVERPLPAVKSLPYVLSLRANERARKNGFYEALLVNRFGHVTEGAYANVFWVKDDEVMTPDEQMLPGITRATVLKICKNERLPVRFALPLVGELKAADEVFLTKTTTGPVGVVEIDESTIGNGAIGPVTRKIMSAFAEWVRARCND